MDKLRINRLHFTDAFWSIVLQQSAFRINTIVKGLQDQHEAIENGRLQADVNTGSIGLCTSVCIASAAAYFRPRVVAEVGTFIGRSAFSLLSGAESAGYELPVIHTCDFSNDISLTFSNADRIVRYPRQSSTQMFTELVNEGLSPDFYFIDGRLSNPDADLLRTLRAEQAVFLLDDFQGTEKGVANVMFLQQVFPENFLVAYPYAGTDLTGMGIFDQPLVAAMIPVNRVIFGE